MSRKILLSVVAAIMTMSLFLTGCKPSAFEYSPCQFNVPPGVGIQCGYLSVPENRGRRDSPLIRLHVAIVKPLNSHPAPDPVVVLNGGPGNSSLANINFWLYVFSRIQDKRTLIIFDQRGVGYSQPSLACPEVKNQWQQDWTENLSMQTMDEHEAEALQACHDRLVSQGVELSAYTTTADAADVKDLRTALGFSKWNLYGGAYGTRLALELMREDPQGIRSVILDSVYPPQVNFYGSRADHLMQSIDLLFAHCNADNNCRQSYPDLKEKFSSLVDQLDSQPEVYALYYPSTGTLHKMVLNGDRWIWAASQMFYGTVLPTQLPQMMNRIKRDTPYSVDANLSRLVSINSSLSEGTYYSIQCAEESSFVAITPSKELRLSAEMDTGQMARNCSVWGVNQADSFSREAVSSDIPTLLLSGELDPITPPAWGQLAAKTLTHSQFLAFPGFGHGVLGGGPDGGRCTFKITSDFIANPNQTVNADCIRSLAFHIEEP